MCFHWYFFFFYFFNRIGECLIYLGLCQYISLCTNSIQAVVRVYLVTGYLPLLYSPWGTSPSSTITIYTEKYYIYCSWNINIFLGAQKKTKKKNQYCTANLYSGQSNAPLLQILSNFHHT